MTDSLVERASVRTGPAESHEGNEDHPSVLAGRFRLADTLGTGGMATVYRATDLKTGRLVAAKVARSGPGMARRSASLGVEAATMSAVAHPNVPRVVDAGRDASSRTPYLCLEFASRGSVSDAVRSHGRLQPDLVASWMVQVLCALSEIHDHGIVHRDVKPGNILITGDGRALLADFGVVKTPDNDMPIAKGAVVGTLSFMSPEQMLDADEVEARADLYSVGATMFAMLTATTPFGLAADDARLQKVPEALRAVVIRATDREPSNRYPDAHAMAQDLAPHVRPRLWAMQPHVKTWLDGALNGPAFIGATLPEIRGQQPLAVAGGGR